MAKYGHDKLITDWKHWLGWGITTGVVVGVFHFLGVHLHDPWYNVAILFGVVAIVDVIKHLTKLQ